jgi:hypothetical protein
MKKYRVMGKWSPLWEGPFEVVQVFSNGAYEIEELAPIKALFGSLEGKERKCFEGCKI